MEDDLNTIRNFFKQGGTVQALHNIPPSYLDQVYSYAYQLFTSGNYSDAKRYYQILTHLSHWQFEYWLSLGMCCQRLHEHSEAVFCFGQSGLLRLDDPRSPYLAGLSHRLTGESELAVKAFSAGLKWCADKPEHAALKAEIEEQLRLTLVETTT